MSTYIRRPVRVEAAQWTGDNPDEMYALCGMHWDCADDNSEASVLTGTYYSWRDAYPGDWVVRFNNDYFELVSDDTFEADYYRE